MIFIDETHIKASANKKKLQKEQVAKAAKVYEEQLRKEVSEERKKQVPCDRLFTELADNSMLLSIKQGPWVTSIMMS